MNAEINVKNKQPAGLDIFCLSVFFERYGFYIVQALLILYLVKFLRLDDGIAYSVLGSFIALSNIMPLIGGFIADKYWGLRYSIFVGAILECVGVLLLILPSQCMLYCGLSVFSMGVGLLKPSLSSLLGYLYQKNDARQDAGYTIFYIGLNAGITLSILISGFLVRYIGWQLTFLTAAVALIVTYLVFYFGLAHYHLKSLGTRIQITSRRNRLAIFTILATILIGFVILRSELLSIITLIVTSISVIGIFAYCITRSDKEYQGKLVAFFILLVISVVFWAMFGQMFLAITLFVDNVVDKNLLGIAIPASTFISIEAFSVVIFGYPLARLWLYLSKTRYNPSLPMKFGIAMILLSISIAVLVFGSQLREASALVNPTWILISYVVLGIGELALSPVGLSMVNTLVPEQFNGMMMGIFLLTIGLGGKIGGLLAQSAKIPSNLSHNTAAIASIYNHTFNIYLTITLICTVISLLLVPYIKRKIAGTS
jgi:POT family proton-dependent oligopeptide transporter